MEGLKFMNTIMDNMDLSVAQICKVVNYNKATHMADIQPLVGEQAMLINVPVATFKFGDFSITAPLQAGDVVIALFLDIDSENAIITGNMSEANSERKHSLDDAVIIGSIYTMNSAADIDDALVIQSKKAKITINADGDIDIEADKVNIKGDLHVEGHLSGGAVSGNI